MNNDYIGLKWGSLKCWNVDKNSNTQSLIEQYLDSPDIGFDMCSRRDSPEQVEMICNIIDSFDGHIFSDWSGKTFTKETAKKYVREYGKTA